MKSWLNCEKKEHLRSLRPPADVEQKEELPSGCFLKVQRSRFFHLKLFLFFLSSCQMKA